MTSFSDNVVIRILLKGEQSTPEPSECGMRKASESPIRIHSMDRLTIEESRLDEEKHESTQLAQPGSEQVRPDFLIN